MPFKSDAQRRFLYARHPKIARRWTREGGTSKDLPEHVKQVRDKVRRRRGRKSRRH